jgi:hypothetical protein
MLISDSDGEQPRQNVFSGKNPERKPRLRPTYLP